jgi:hypothetical protein
MLMNVIYVSYLVNNLLVALMLWVSTSIVIIWLFYEKEENEDLDN